MHRGRWIKGSSVLLALIMACSVVAAQPVFAAEADEEVVTDAGSENEEEAVDNGGLEEDEPEEEDASAEESGSDDMEEESEPASDNEEEIVDTDSDADLPRENEEEETDTEPDADEEIGLEEDEAAPALSEVDFPEISSYGEFMAQLPVLEEYAEAYAAENPKEDADALVINFIRNGVDRYNSDSWAIIAGSEKTEFVEYVLAKDSELGTQATSLRKLNPFNLPNGDAADFGHMFGTMDIISYKGNIHSDTADMGGWAGDICDLASYSKNHGVSATDVDGMADEIRENYLHVDVETEHSFGDEDIHGDLDGYYLMSELQNGGSSLSQIMDDYFTSGLSETDRAVYFLNHHFAGKNSKELVRTAIYETYKNNSGIIMLEADRGLSGDKDLTKACSYAFADYLYELAKDEIGGEDPDDPGPDDPVNPDEPPLDNEYYSVFSSKKSNLAPGVTQEIRYATTADGKQLAYYLAYADVGRDDVNVYANYNNNTADTWKMARVSDQMEAARRRHSDPDDPDHYVENYTPVVGINADFYNMSTGVPSGALIMEGIIYHELGNENFFGILNDGTPIIGGASEWAAHKNDLREAVGAGSMIVRNGKSVISKTDNYTNNRASRTCVGITGDGRVVFMVLDGRQEPFSAGGSAQEIAQIMEDAGCDIAVNLDGGGSSTFVAKQEGADSPSVVNRPSDGYERSVSSSLMVVSGARPSNEFEHAIITSDQDYVTKGTSLKLSVSGVSVSGGSAEVPEGAVLRLTDTSIGSLDEDVFTASAAGETEVQLVIGEEVVATKTLHVVTPDTLAFERTKLSAIYGVDTPLPLKAYYEGKEVAISEKDVNLQLSEESAGTLNGFMFNGDENSNIRVVKVTALLWDNFDVEASAQITLYKNGEAVFDFENATVTLDDGDFAYTRDVPNATKQQHDEIGMIYHLNDPHKPLDVSYVFAIDMKGIKIPEKLAPMIALLPGGDTVDATPWNFMLQLAERVGTMSEVKVDFKVDPNMDIDYSNLTFANEYFRMDTVTFDEETHTLSIICHWIDQTQAIDPATANPMCILSGITLTPKEDAPWDNNNYLRVKNVGTISYDVYLRSSTLYSVASDPGIQEEYGIYPYRATDILYNGAPESGGHFSQQYLAFDDEYVLDSTVLDGWVTIEDKLYYFEDNVMMTGIHEVPGYNDEGNKYYYSFDDDGVCIEKVSGLFELDGDKYFAKNGVLQSGWQSISNGGTDIDFYYFDKTTHKAVDGEQVIDGYHYRFEDCILVRGELVKRPNGEIWYRWAGDWASQRWFDVDGDKYYFRSNYAAAVNLRSFNIDNVNVFYVFSEEGVWQENVSGLYDTPDGNTYLVEKGIVVNYPGLVKIDDDYYYFGYIQPYAAYKNATRWIDKTNGLLPAANYQFDEKGRIINPPVPAVQYQVTFDANGGQGAMSAQSFEKGKQGVLKGVEFTRAGYAFSGWNTESDGSGDSYSDRQTVSLTADLKLYAQWVKDGWDTDENGRTWYDRGEKVYFDEWASIDGKDYYFKPDGYVATDLYETNAKDDSHEAAFVFDHETGEFLKNQNGLYNLEEDTYWTENGEVVVYAGLVRTVRDDGEVNYYYFGEDNKAVKNVPAGGQDQWIPKEKTNGLLPEWGYYIDAQGVLLHDEDTSKNGILDEDGGKYYYIDGIRVHMGLIKINEDYYYVKSGGEVITGKSYYCTRMNELEEQFPEGTYTFDEEGRMIFPEDKKNGIYEEDGSLYYYVDGKRTYGGLMEIDGDYYYAATSGEVVHGKKYWISKTNDLLPEKSYEFADDGKIIFPPAPKNGIYEEDGSLYYYVNDVRTYGGVMEIDGDYYYAASSGEIVHGRKYWISKTNDLIPERSYTFDEQGRITDAPAKKDESMSGIVEEDGSLYYYEKGLRTYGGVMLIDGKYYYAATSGEVVHGRKYWISKTNGLLKEKSYTFDDNGVITDPVLP